MELSVQWSKLAETKLREIYSYRALFIGDQVAIELIYNIVNRTNIHKKSPHIGHLEPLLNNRVQPFRYQIYADYKIIYFIDSGKNQIKITNVFDCRQNPLKIEETK